MRSNIRISLLALVVGALVLLAAAPAASALGGFAKFFAGNCSVGHQTCGEPEAKEGNKAEAEAEGFVQAGGFVPFGVTDFTVQKVEIPGNPGVFAPISSIKNLRVDVAPGVVTSPQGAGLCSIKEFTGKEVGGKPGHFTEPHCPESSVIGENKVKTVLPLGGGKFADIPLSGPVYNLEQEQGQGTTFGVALVVGANEVVHTIIKGSVEWGSDYHDYFIINNITPGLLESRLVFFGAEKENKITKEVEKYSFLRNGTKCAAVGPETTTTVTGEFEGGAISSKPWVSLVGGTGCAGLKFEPTFALTPESALSDQPDGITTELTETHPESGIDGGDLESITLKMPEGMTMNPSAAAALEGCTPEQAGVGQTSAALEITKLNAIGCPSGSKLGTVNLEVPTLPAGALQGPIFLGRPAGKSIEAPPYTVYLDAESARYGIRVLLKGTITPNPVTGQLTVTFNENPQAPFKNVALHFNGGAFAPIANPLVCGAAHTEVVSTSYTGKTVASPLSEFIVGGCTSSPPPFAPTQGTFVVPATGGTETNFTFSLERSQGQQYLEKVKTVLPPGLVGKIPTVPLCTEAQAKADEAELIAQGCTAASKVGTALVTAGSGEPFPFNGTVYLTGPYQGAPYGLLTVVPVKAGPFNLGYEVTRAKIEVEPNTARVVVTSTLSTIRRGIPTRLRSLTVNINRPNYILNPTNCGVLQTESTLTSTLGATALASSPFQVEGCSSLAFKPTFKATTFGRPSKKLGASIETTINQPSGQANIKQVVVQLPRQLPSRLSTLQKACPEATFAANPFNCPVGSLVGGVRANTPVLPGKMTGPAYLVSHGGAAFPDLDLVLEANGVRVILTGNTDIKKGITTTSFLTGPDVPISSITTTLPIGPHSALAANGNLCASSLVMPTTITGQNGKQVKQNTKIAVSGCGVRIVGHKVIGNTAYLTVQTFSAGRISGGGANLATVYRSLGSAANTATLKVPLSPAGRSRHRPLNTRVRVGFVPKQRGAQSSTAFVTVTFR